MKSGCQDPILVRFRSESSGSKLIGYLVTLKD